MNRMGAPFWRKALAAATSVTASYVFIESSLHFDNTCVRVIIFFALVVIFYAIMLAPHHHPELVKMLKTLEECSDLKSVKSWR